MDARTLLDTCSSANFITESFAKKLRLPMRRCAIPIRALNSTYALTKFAINLTIKSKKNNFEKKLNFLTVPSIAGLLPAEGFPRETLAIPRNISLADPEFHIPRPVEMLIGAGPTLSALSVGNIDLSKGKGDICLQKTQYGWIIAGAKSLDSSNQDISCHLIALEKQIEKFWVNEELPGKGLRSKEDIECENHYKQNTSRNTETGRYTVSLPFRKNKRELGNSYIGALKRLEGLERKFAKNRELQQGYAQQMRDLIHEGFMSVVEMPEKDGFYLPHHAVIKNSSDTTKIRIVYDASAKSDSGVSLNDILMTGPQIQSTLFHQLLKFRFPRYAITADIEKMYLQVNLHEHDKKYQYVLWRTDNEQIKTFQLNTVTFGVSSSAFLATRTLCKLAEDEKSEFPRAAEAIKNDIYVDDFMGGESEIRDAIALRNDVTALLKRGGFNIRKWASNDERILQGLSQQNINANFQFDKECILKTLGVSWNPKNDTITYAVKNVEIKPKITKRCILSEIAKIFDPLGLLGPIILHAKKIMQEVWKCKVDWDESVPMQIHTAWLSFTTQLSLINNLQFERKMMIDNFCELQIHAFCDASETGYGACFYIRSVDNEGNVICRLLCGKSRVAPIKPTTIPRLELNAALVLARLYLEVREAVTHPIKKVHFWTDSMIVLHWFKKPVEALQTYVANRVNEIIDCTEGSHWGHVKSGDNPADALSRGQLPSAFLSNAQWQRGPTWLSEPEERWPEQRLQLKEELPEIRKNVCLATSLILNELLTRFTPYSKMLRIASYCYRFIDYTRTKTKKYQDNISTAEIQETETKIVKMVQSIYLSGKIEDLTSSKNSNKARYAVLNPFFDEKGVIRVGGRLQNANLPYAQRHPILLPNNNAFTDLILRETHEKQHHAGIHATLYTLRQKFWVLDGRNQIRKIVHSCMRCIRFKTKEINYKMGNLPEMRVSAARPFASTGIDFCGPFYIKEKKHRNRIKIKVYVCVFVCMAIKATHLEVVSDLTSEGFLGAFRRFVARRGLPTHCYSDNGTNFVGAKRELDDIYAVLNSQTNREKIARYAADQRITWHFNPPYAPHFGGLWEAAVKSFKHHLKRVMGELVLTFEELNTLTIEIEGILNSRPLAYLSSDPNDPLTLSPAHYLIGESLNTLPELDWNETPANRLSVWQHLAKVRQDFWRRWSVEYLNELQQRNKWRDEKPNLSVGNVVLVKDKNMSCMQWPLGRIVKTHPGDDGIVRTVTIATARGESKRAVKQLALLPHVQSTN